MTERLSRWRLVAFSAPALPLSSLGLPIIIYLPAYYASEMGLGLAAVGFVFTITRLIDVVTDPIMGVVSDRYPSRWGRRRHWLVLSIPLLMVSIVLIFMPKLVLGEDATVTWVYLLVALSLVYLGFTLATLSHTAWGAELSSNYDERSRIQGYREFAYVVGMFTILSLPAVIEFVGGEGWETWRMQAVGWFAIVLVPTTIAIAVIFVPERPAIPVPRIGLREAVRAVLENRFMMRILLADFLQALGGVRGALNVFYMKYVIQAPEWTSTVILAYFAAAIVAVPIWMRISRRIGKHKAYAMAMLGHVLVTAAYLIPGKGDVALIGVLFFFSGLVYGGAPLIMRSIIADVTDHDNVETGAQRTGLYFALNTMIGKTGAALTVGLSFLMLSWIGFDPDPGTVNTPGAVDGLRYIYALPPVVFEIGVFLLLYTFPLDRARQEELQRLIAERDRTATDSSQA
jgi:Na+/melibiose symporter-like transporter